MTPRRATTAVVSASLGGLVLGAFVPGAERVAAVGLAAIFVQTLVTVGSLVEPTGERTGGLGRPARMVALHHLVTSAPLMGLGLLLGLETPLGAGIYLLGAVPPAAGLPSYAAACGVPVRPILRYCLLAYAVGIVATPVLVLVGVGREDSMGRLAATLVFGLVAPALLAQAGSRWLSRLPRRAAFALVASSIAVLTVGLGPSLRLGVEQSVAEPAALVTAVAVAFGRTLVGGTVCAVAAPSGRRREMAMVGSYKNAALAAILSLGASTPLAALPALLSLFSEALALVVLARAGTAGGTAVPTSGQVSRPST